ncbi:MAG: hypothetical protein LBH67_03020 [Rickettsia sp.]|jgi:membrane-anchored glycerophosphoryl diester phosphodiesterase (GDPDase)|nr:hypothetical protein [Rickettsia sp.]
MKVTDFTTGLTLIITVLAVIFSWIQTKWLMELPTSIRWLYSGTVERRDRYGIMKKKKKREL